MGSKSHNKGQEDRAKSGGKADSNPLKEAGHPTYKPPAGGDKEYKKGWDHAGKQDKK